MPVQTSAELDGAVAAAAAAVSREHYTSHPKLGAVPQATAQFAIERDLRRASIQPGMRVLEIGTGSGLTGALLAELVGSSGQVISVDIDPSLTRRAAMLHAERGVTNLTLVTGDGHAGAPGYGPYDAILAWAAPMHIPVAWAGQCRSGAVISTPVYIAPIARAVGHIRATVASHQTLADLRLGHASYVDMGNQVNTDLGLPVFYLDARTGLYDGGLAWISVGWRDHVGRQNPADALALLTQAEHTETIALADTEEKRALAWHDFRSYSAAREAAHPRSSLTAYGTTSGTRISGIGFSSGNHAAILADDGTIYANRADSPALAKLHDYYRDWNTAGRPGLDHLTPTLHPGAEGWPVRTTLGS